MPDQAACHAEAPQPAAEATAAAPQTPPTSSETGLFVHPAPAEVAANLADHVGPVTPPPGSSHQSQPALGSDNLSADQNGAAQPSDQAAAGIPAPTRGEAAPVDPERAAAASQGAQQEAEPMQVTSSPFSHCHGAVTVGGACVMLWRPYHRSSPYAGELMLKKA